MPLLVEILGVYHTTFSASDLSSTLALTVQQPQADPVEVLELVIKKNLPRLTSRREYMFNDYVKGYP